MPILLTFGLLGALLWFAARPKTAAAAQLGPGLGPASQLGPAAPGMDPGLQASYVSAMVTPMQWDIAKLGWLYETLAGFGHTRQAAEIAEIQGLVASQLPIIANYQEAMVRPETFPPGGLKWLSDELRNLGFKLLPNVVLEAQ